MVRLARYADRCIVIGMHNRLFWKDENRTLCIFDASDHSTFLALDGARLPKYEGRSG